MKLPLEALRSTPYNLCKIATTVFKNRNTIIGDIGFLFFCPGEIGFLFICSMTDTNIESSTRQSNILNQHSTPFVTNAQSYQGARLTCQLQVTDLMICAPWAGVTFGCLANGMDHTPCCRSRGLPESCLPLCSGNITSLDFNHFKLVVQSY